MSEQWRGGSAPLVWRCSQGHVWEATFSNVFCRRTWCPLCANDAQRLGIAEANRIAASHGGQCLSSGYRSCRELLQWACSRGHVFIDSLYNMRLRRSWCPECRYVDRLLLAKQIAERRGGQCESSLCERVSSRLVWRCARGHPWSASLRSVKDLGSWCPECSRRRVSIEDARRLAASKGGACLSAEVRHHAAALRWRCARGHEWLAPWHSIRSKAPWCPHCRNSKGEDDVRRIFENVFLGQQFPRCRPDFLRGTRGRPLELDGYSEALRLAFEFNGVQHYDPSSFFHRSIRSFEEMLGRDRLKQAVCSRVGVRLVVVPYCVVDRLTFVRSALLRWFAVSSIFRAAIAA